MKIIHLVCATRPNFMKIAPLFHELKNENWCELKIIHTGQHYDYQMSQTFFNDFDLPKPHYYLNVGSGTHAEQTARTMLSYEKLCINDSKPDLVIVVGDVNATMSCSIVAKKLHLKVAHLEAGLRSFDRSMPEEINRIVTDAICDYYWIPSKDAEDNLLHEGVKQEQIHFVGNIMIDSYCNLQEKIKQKETYKLNDLVSKNYVVLTLHRPKNVDDVKDLKNILEKIAEIEEDVIFPVHPRTKKSLEKIKDISKNIKLIDPLSYLDFMNLVTNAKYVISDSGGVQEETTYLNIPCYTLRDNTERPITCDIGSNQLVTIENLLTLIKERKDGKVPPLWDGKTSLRIKKLIKELL